MKFSLGLPGSPCSPGLRPQVPPPVSLKDLGILFPLDSPSPLELEASGWHMCSSPLVLWGPWGRGSGEVPTGGTGQGCHLLRARNKGSLKAEQRPGSPGQKARRDVSLNLPQPQLGKPLSPRQRELALLIFPLPVREPFSQMGTSRLILKVAEAWELPGGPAVRTLRFHRRGHGLHTWWRAKIAQVMQCGLPPTPPKKVAKTEFELSCGGVR